MQSDPEVKVTKLAGEVSVNPNAGFTPWGLLRTHLNQLLDRRAAEGAREFFLLEWEGGENPRGAVINGTPIVVTANGMVVGAGGKLIGVFEWMVENGGPNHREQKMIVAIR